jgi:hypothetical protein
MTTDEAKFICRNSGRSKQEMKRVLDRSREHPDSTMISWLLLLATNAFAARKSLHAELEQALLVCGKENPEPLWEHAEKDWDNRRVLCAVVALLKAEAPDTDRLVRLCRKPLEMEWDRIQNWAATHRFSFPDDVVQQQAVWQREQHSIISPATWALTVDRKQRKREWPVERDLLPAPPAPPHPRPDGYGETDTASHGHWTIFWRPSSPSPLERASVYCLD